VGENEDGGVEGVFAAPTVGDVERPSAVTMAPIEENASRNISAPCFETLNVISPLGTTYSVSPLEYQSKGAFRPRREDFPTRRSARR
jgi:hypothetical protein